MLERDQWLPLARKLDWKFSYVSDEDVYPQLMSGTPWLPTSEWAHWEEPFKTSFAEYVRIQNEKNVSVAAVRDLLGDHQHYKNMPADWLNGIKFYAATFPLAEFAATIGNLRAARFGRDSAWRTMSGLGALDEFRHTQIPLTIMHELLKVDGQFDWTHRFYHTNDWVAIAARHLIDEMLLAANPIEFAIATNFVFETGFTNLQFIALTTLAQNVGDPVFEKMLTSIQTDEARHAQIGRQVLEVVLKHDPEYVQHVLDKWFWRSWLFFSVLTGFTMDYLTPVDKRSGSFKEFVNEWVLDQYISQLDELGLKRPWYWDQFVASLDHYHHMVYASAYTHRATVWFDMVMPGPKERAWLKEKYPASWPQYEPIWQNIENHWRHSHKGIEWGTHGATPVTFCDLCQFVLSGGTPEHNTARTAMHDGKKYIFCSEPCEWIFKMEPARYASHKDLVKRILAGEVPTNLLEIVTRYFGLTEDSWGRDAFGGDYSWLKRDKDKE